MNNMQYKTNNSVILFSYHLEENDYDLNSSLIVECPKFNDNNEVPLLKNLLSELSRRTSENEFKEMSSLNNDSIEFEFLTSLPFSIKDKEISIPGLGHLLVPGSTHKIKKKTGTLCNDYFMFQNSVKGLLVKKADNIDLESFYFLMSLVPDIIPHIVFECNVHPGFNEWSKKTLDHVVKWRWQQLLSLLSPILMNTSEQNVNFPGTTDEKNWKKIIKSSVNDFVTAYQFNDRNNFEKAVESILCVSSNTEIPEEQKYFYISTIASSLIELGESERAIKIMEGYKQSAIDTLYNVHTVEELASSSLLLQIMALAHFQNKSETKSYRNIMNILLKLLSVCFKQSKLAHISALQLVQTIMLMNMMQNNQNTDDRTAEQFFSIVQFLLKGKDFRFEDIILNNKIRMELLKKYESNVASILLIVLQHLKKNPNRNYYNKTQKILKNSKSSSSVKRILIIDDINNAIECGNEIQYHKGIIKYENDFKISTLPDYIFLKASIAFSRNAKIKKEVNNYLEHLEDKRQASMISGNIPDLNMHTIYDICNRLLNKQYSKLAEPFLEMLRDRINGMNDMRLNNYIQGELLL